MRAFAVAGVVAALLVAGLALATPVRGARNISELLVEDAGSTDILGGGDYVFVRVGADAAFGVLWGNDTNPNGIYFVALKARYLGVGQVFDTSGRQILTNFPIRYWNLYAVRLLTILEYRDQNGNGVADYRRGYNETTGDFTWYSEGEDVSKLVNLTTNWTRGTVSRATTAAGRSWEFNLTARDLPYYGVNNTIVPRGNDRLDLLRFTFHLNATFEEVDGVAVPSFRITVDTSRVRDAVQNVTREADLTFSGRVVRYNLKWDQEIVGWDFDPQGPRRLLLEFAALVGNLVLPGLANWVDDRFVDQSGDAGRVRYDTATGNVTADNRTGELSTPQRLRSPYLDFGGNWSRVGLFRWVDNSTVDGVTRPVYAQILAGRRVAARGELGGAYVGFAILGGLSYAEGAEIVHDPEVTTDAITQLTLPTDGVGTALLAVAVVVIIVVVVLAALLFMRRPKAPAKTPPPPPK